MKVLTGLETWVSEGFSELKGKKVGAIVNPTSVDSHFRHLGDILSKTPGIQLRALFGPEHGILGQAQYMESVDTQITERQTHIPLYSLYGSTLESLTPKQEWLQELDALVFDIQDVGSRYYTYVYTMALAMSAAARAGKAFYVLDRPNPLGGNHLEGNLVEEGFHSFVGLFSLPNRHAMTAGELALLFNAKADLKCQLKVIPMKGWQRGMYWENTGLPFVPPSPNMPTFDTSLVYPGMCLLEGTNISEGRGTCRPFEQFGAPWLHAQAVVERLNAERLPGVRFREVSFIPTFDKYRSQLCQGAMLHVTDRNAFRPYLTGLAVVKTAHDLGGKHFGWREDAYEFVDDIPAFDLLVGTSTVRKGIEGGKTLAELTQGFEAQLQEFQLLRQKFLLYE